MVSGPKCECGCPIDWPSYEAIYGIAVLIAGELEEFHIIRGSGQDFYPGIDPTELLGSSFPFRFPKAGTRTAASSFVTPVRLILSTILDNNNKAWKLSSRHKLRTAV